MRVIIDLVVNHTSDSIPWFRSARASRDSPYRDFYVWRATSRRRAHRPGRSSRTRSTASGSTTSRRGSTTCTGSTSTQPDLNITNPLVRDEIVKTMGFWLELGLSGFRVDAVPFMLETTGVHGEVAAFPDPHDVPAQPALLPRPAHRGRDPARRGEPAAQGPAEVLRRSRRRRTAHAVRLHRDAGLYLALARSDARPLARALTSRPRLRRRVAVGQLRPQPRRAHPRQAHRRASARRCSRRSDPSRRCSCYGRGLIRRLPPMLDGDPRRIRMVYSLSVQLPGTPVLFYGEEIGMGENLAPGDRFAVRTPMQWSPARNGGFSRASRRTGCPGTFVYGPYGPDFVNVTDQLQRRRVAAGVHPAVHPVLSGVPELGWASFEVLDHPMRPSWLIGAPGTTVGGAAAQPVAGCRDRAIDPPRPAGGNRAGGPAR